MSNVTNVKLLYSWESQELKRDVGQAETTIQKGTDIYWIKTSFVYWIVLTDINIAFVPLML